MANSQTSTPDRAAECGRCGQTAARHIWGPERASMAGDGCDGWTEEASASSASLDAAMDAAVAAAGPPPSLAQPDPHDWLVGKAEFGDPDFGPGGYFEPLPDEATTARLLAQADERGDGLLTMEEWDAFTADISRTLRKAVA